MMAGIGISCVLRNSTDRYYYRVQTLMPAFIASYLALLVERPSRRPALAFYMANLSSELLYKWAVGYNYIKPLPNGETLLFAAGLACYMHFVRVNGFGHDPVSTAIKLLVGREEAKSRSRSSKLPVSGSNEHADLSDDTRTSNKLQIKTKRQHPIIEAYNASHATLSSILNSYFVSHPCCPHKETTSCLDYACNPILSRFALGYLIKSAMNMMGQLRIIRKQPLLAISNAFSAKSSTQFGLFLASLVSVTRASHCILRRCTNESKDWHSAIAGGLGGLSMYFSPKSTLSTYVIWKCLEQYFFLAVKQGKIVHANECIGLIYAISVNVLLYTFALEPRFIRASYMKFIDRLSDHRLHQINRMVLDVFGTKSSVGYEDFFPDLEPKYISRQFNELVFNWLIQPY